MKRTRAPNLSSLALCFLCLSTANIALSKDYGSFGALFPVEEPSVLETIFSRLNEMDANGELAQMEDDMKQTVRDRVKRPKPVLGIVAAQTYRRYEVDLSIVVQQDLADHNGVVFAKAGTVVNPLDFSRFSKRLVFIDGDVPEQVEFALKVAGDTPVKIILVNGEPLTLTDEHQVLFYFDQGGSISDKFAISEVPAVVSRSYPNMIVEVIPVEEKPR